MKQPIFNNKQQRLIVLSGLGGMLEFYDFIIYALLASYIAHNFFPGFSNVTSLMATFATFSVGYLVRPLGGVIFGHFGDRIGRRFSFTSTIFLMAISTFAIGLVPSYQSIGMTAPIVLLILRIIQGFSIGGEIPGAITYISETIPRRRGLGCGLIFFCLINGIVLGLMVMIFMNVLLSQSQIVSWGWRLPFFIGGIFGAIGYILRRHFYESPMFAEISRVARIPLLTVLRNHFRAFVCGTFLVALGASLITLLFLFTPAYMTNLLHYPVSQFTAINTLCLFVATLMIIGFGHLGDRSNKKAWLIIISVLTLVLAFPIFHMFVNHIYSPWLPMLLSTLLLGTIWGFIPPVLAELFPTNVRYSGIGFTYNIGFAVFGGLTPLIAMALIRYTHILQSPSYYLIATAVLGLICSIALPKKKLL